MIEVFWITLAATVVGGLMVWWCVKHIELARARERERQVFDFLRDHTQDRSGQQYVPIKQVAAETGITPELIEQAVAQSTRLFRREGSPGEIGLFPKERSIYEERGLIVL